MKIKEEALAISASKPQIRWRKDRATMKTGLSGDKMNPVDKNGKVTLYAICSSKMHWKNDCPHKDQKKKISCRPTYDQTLQMKSLTL